MQFDQLKRREFITLLSVASLWPLVVRAQQPDRIRLIGVLMGFAENDPTAQSMVAAFRAALAKLGWTEGGNVRIELRWSGYDRDRIKTLAKELVDLRPDVILGQTTPVTAALARETQGISIVFVTVSDPIGSGLAASLAHPGGNVTGFSVDDITLGSKWMELLKEIAPRTERVALLFNPAGPPLQSAMPSIQAAASSFHVQVSTATVYSKDEIENVVAAQAGDPAGGLIVMPSTFNTTNRELTPLPSLGRILTDVLLQICSVNRRSSVSVCRPREAHRCASDDGNLVLQRHDQPLILCRFRRLRTERGLPSLPTSAFRQRRNVFDLLVLACIGVRDCGRAATSP
jgi:putative tryptophan/tyrosine transport system substrate-binding protein